MATNRCWWCNRVPAVGSYDRFSRFTCYPCQQIQEAEAVATRHHVAAQAEASRLRALSAEVAERAAMWQLPPA